MHHLHTGHLGTPLEASNDAGEVTWRVTYRAWGSVVVEEVAEIRQRVRFPGQYLDAETGLHYNRFRYYEPQVGRFISQDPIGLEGGFNTFSFPTNPITWTDVLGLEPDCPCKDVKWKGFSKGKLSEHFDKHVKKGGEFGDITQSEYLKQAKAFAAETGNFKEQKVGNFIVKYDPETRRTFVGHQCDREIRTFYRADERSADPFGDAVDLARKLGGG